MSTVVLYREGDEDFDIKSKAMLKITYMMTTPWWLFYYPLFIVPSPIRDKIYDVLSKYRHKVAGTKDKA